MDAFNISSVPLRSLLNYLPVLGRGPVRSRVDSTGEAPMKNAYDPFIRGRFPVGVRTFQATDERDRIFPCEIWYPAAERYAGQDMARETQDSFIAPPFNRPRL